MVACDDTRNADPPQRASDQQRAGRTSVSPRPSAVPRSGYRFLAVIIGAVHRHAGPLAETLDATHRKGGRKGYGGMPKLTAFFLQFILNIRYANRFLSELDANSVLLAMCGLEQAPDEGTYSRFKKRLTNYQDEIDDIVSRVVAGIGDELERLREAGVVPADAPQLGDYIAFDSTDVEAYGNPKRSVPRDPDARWGHRTPNNKSSGTKDKEMFYGYKVHEATDAYYGIPLAGITLPANEGDGPQMPKVLAEVQRLHPQFETKYGLADKAYAGLGRLQHLVDNGIVPIVAVPRPREDEEGQRLYEGIYTAAGRLTCIGREPMEFLGTDPEKGHLFRCPAGGCALKHKVDWSRYCDYEVWEKPEGKLLRIIGILPRFTAEWKLIYRMRTAIERYFRSAKHSRLMNQHQCLEGAKVSLHVRMSRLAYLSTVLARLKADDYVRMRHMRVRLPKAKRRKAKELPETACHRHNCTCCSWWAEAA